MIKLPKVKGQILYNASLAKYSWFAVGGNAEAIFKPQNLEDLQYFLKNIDKKINLTIIGGGSNILIRDGGIEGVVITLKNTLKDIKLLDNYIEVECGATNLKLFEFARNNGIEGYSEIATIPGTIGGAIRGNAGCYGIEIKDILLSVDAIDLNGNLRTFTNEECKFEYRKNNLPQNLIFTKAKFKILSRSSSNEIEKKYKEIIEKRNKTQPIGEKTCGSTFKNNPDKPAWKIIQEIGYQNKEVNGAKMSEKHANFMINYGNATAKSLEDLTDLIKKEAKEKQNIDLELEIQIMGKDKSMANRS